MKKALCLTILLLTMISIAMAQPAAITKGEVVDTLCQNRLSVEIVSEGGMHFDHPQHPATGVTCPFVKGFTTSQTYSWYSWESSFFEPENSNTVLAHVYDSGYIKVTVGDNYGHTGTDSIWFNVRNHDVPPMEDFIMEIDDDLHANFHGIAAQEHHILSLYRCYIPELYTYHEDFILSPGEWSYSDINAVYSEDTLWLYYIPIYDVCNSAVTYRIPGLLLNTNEDEYGGHHLIIKTILQRDDATFYNNQHFVYFVYTIDEYGNRHQIWDNNGNPVILQPKTTSWQIPGPHIDPYYQCGVGRQLDDGSYVLLSLSNKVPNPWPDSDGINEGEETIFSIFPNPSHGQVTVVGKGTLSVVNMLGQIVLRQEIDGESTLELPRGIYFVKLGGAVRKVVVE